MRSPLLLLASFLVFHTGWVETVAAQDSTPAAPPARTPTVTATEMPSKAAISTTPTHSATPSSKSAQALSSEGERLEIRLTYTFWFVFLGSVLATFVASIMADEQDKRLRNGTFGAVAGSSVGALAALIANDRLLIVSGFCGSGVGALLGWLVSLLLSYLAATTLTGKTMLAYQIGGLTAVKEKLDLEENDSLKRALEEWGRRFARRVDRQHDEVVCLPKGKPTNGFITVLLRGWLCSTVDVLGLLFKLAKKPEYQNRITLIIFGLGDKNTPIGKHWILDSGVLQPHNPEQEFDESSIGYKVLSRQCPSPYFFTNSATTSGANGGQNRGAKQYRPFWTFRINDSAVLSIDCPGDLDEKNQFLRITRDLFHLEIGPKIESTLAHWSEPSKLYQVVGLMGPLPQKPASTLPATGASAAVVANTETASAKQDQLSSNQRDKSA